MNYEQLREDVFSRKDKENPKDYVIPVMDTEYQYDTATSTPMLIDKKKRYQPFKMTQWGHQQLCGKLGIPNPYINKCPPSLKETNINTFLKGNLGEFKLRVVGDNVVRAVLSPSFTPIDDYELVDLITPFVQANDVEIISYHTSELMTSIRGVFKRTDKTRDELQKGDVVQKGIVVNNSEVGYMAVQFRALLYRLVCTNGLIAPKEMGGFHFRHRGNKERLMSYSGKAVDDLTVNLDGYLQKFDASRLIEVADPIKRIEADVDEKNWPDKWLDIFTTSYHVEPSNTLFGVINAYTRGAQKLSLHNRVEVEEFAMGLLQTV